MSKLKKGRLYTVIKIITVVPPGVSPKINYIEYTESINCQVYHH